MISREPFSVVFYGISGAGKGTQIALLQDALKSMGDTREVLHIETGALSREFAKKEGHTQTMVSAIMKEGGLFPAFLPVHLWGNFLIEKFTGGQHLFFDGVARREYEVPILDAALWFYGRGDYTVIAFTLSEETARARLHGRSRADDIDEEAITHRFSWYRENVEPAIERFEKMGKIVHRVNAEGTTEEIHKEVLKCLGLSV